MDAGKAVVLAIVFLLSAIAPAITVEGANDARTDTDTGYLSEKWHAGIGTGTGALNSIKSADIDADGEDELIFGNSQGFVHVMDWNASANAFTEIFQSVDMGGPVKGMAIAQIDEDEQLEIAIGYNWNADSGKVKIIDGISLLAEANWSSGISWSHTQWTEGWPYGLAMGDLDGDERAELAMSADRGFLWVVDTKTPEIYVGRDVTSDEAEWYMDVGSKTSGGTLENTWGLTFGQFDDDEAIEVAVGSKEGWVGVFDGVTQELQWKYDMDGSSGADSLCYSMISADLNGNDIDELIVPQQNKITVFIDGDRDARVDDSDINSGYGLASANLFGNSNEELVVADGSGNIRIMSLAASSLTTHQEWYGGYPMNTGAGVTIAMNGPDKPWIIHGSDSGVLVGWEVTSQSEHSMVWKSEADSNSGQKVYSLEGGKNYAIAMGNIDDDDNLEVLVGSNSGKIFAFDGKTYETDWVSPVLDRPPIGIAIGDLNNDGDNEIAVSTGVLGEPKGEDGDGAEGYLYIFERSGSNIVEAYQSGNIDTALGITISELDGSTYPEIGIASGYLEIESATAGTTSLHGNVRVYGYGGSSYSEEWESNDLGQIVGGIDSGDPDGDGTNELVVGTGGDDREGEEESGEVRVYERMGGTYSVDGSVIDTGRYYAYGIGVGDVDNDGDEEILVGTGEKGESKPKLAVYDGDSHSVEYSKSVDSSSVWGVKTGDFDSDGFAELIYGTSGGEIFIYDGETEDFEAKTSALSGNAGHYGGIAIGNVDNDGPMEMAIGSLAYFWLFTTEGQTDKPDLAIEGVDITYTPENPNEDEDIIFNLTIKNYGGADTSKWRVKVYDGDPDADGTKITEFSCDATETGQREGCKTLSQGESASFEITWYGIQTTPGYHEIYGQAEDSNQPRQETRFSNNKDFTTIEIEEIPNDRPIIDASLESSVVWVDESVRVNAGDSYDNETTGGAEDNADSVADLEYRYYSSENGWTSWIDDYTWDFSFSNPGNKEIKVMVRDERRKESTEKILSVEVKANTQPVAIISSNITDVPAGGFVTFDVTQSYDPDDRAELEYRFSFGDGVYSDWVSEGETVRLYRNAFFNGPNGGTLKTGSGEEVLRDRFGIIRFFKLYNGELLESKDSGVTGNGYNYSLPEGAEERTYMAQIMAREISETGDNEEILASTWSDSLEIRVYLAANIPPIADANAAIFIGSTATSPWSDVIKSGKTGDTVAFSADGSTDPDGDDTLLEYQWRLIGPSGADISLLGDKYSKTFERTLNEPGQYIAILTVIDSRGGEDTHNVDVSISDSGGTGRGDESEVEGYSTTVLIGGALMGVGGLIGGAMALRRMGGDSDFDEGFEDVTPGPIELQCPSCGGLISITTAQRPIQIGCPICASQFVLRE